MMQSSEQINELATALSKAQGEITGAMKDSANSFFKSKYADLASCWDACRAALSKNGLAVSQQPMSLLTQVPPVTYLQTVLMHTSGQFMISELQCQPKDDSPQAMGSAITYARRYALCAMVGVAQVDDDGIAASGRANAEIHSPKGDMGKNIDPDQAFASAAAMRDLLQADLDHRVKALKIYDKHLILAKDNDLYVAASEQLNTKERADWKVYVNEAKELEKDDRKISNVGKRF